MSRSERKLPPRKVAAGCCPRPAVWLPLVCCLGRPAHCAQPVPQQNRTLGTEPGSSAEPVLRTEGPLYVSHDAY